MKSHGLLGDFSQCNVYLSAEKDEALSYVACSPSYVEYLGLQRLDQVLGTQDVAHLPPQQARENESIDRQVLQRQSADLRFDRAEAGEHFVLRTPIIETGADKPRGIQIVHVTKAVLDSIFCAWFLPTSQDLSLSEHQAFAIVHQEKVVYANADFAEQVALPQHRLSRIESLWDALGIELPPQQRAQWRHGRASNSVSAGVEIDGVDGDARARRWLLQGVRISWSGEPAILIHLKSPVLANKVMKTDKVVSLGSYMNRDIPDPYKQLVDNALNGVLILSGLRPAYANPAAVDLLGSGSIEKLLSVESIAELASMPAHVVRDLQLLYLADQSTMAFDVSLSGDASRSARTVHWALRRIAWKGAPAILASLTEIRLPQTHERLLQNQQRYRDFAESAADYMWELDSELRFSYISPRFLDVMGINPSELLQRDMGVFYNSPHMHSIERSGEQHVKSLQAHHKSSRCEFRWTRPTDGQLCVIQHSGKAVFEGDKFVGYRGIGRDVTQDRQHSEQANYHASHDWLTGLLNRREFERLLREALIETQRGNDIQHVLCYIDLDNFKIVNDTCGHSAGDELLRQLSDLLLSLVRKTDVLARLGGDEFGLMLYDCDLDQGYLLADKVRHAVEGFQFLWDGNRFSVGTSIGMASINAQIDDISKVMSSADAACYMSKEQGRNCINVYRREDETVQSREGEAHWVVKIKQALEERHFKLCQQIFSPVREIDNNGKYVELLLRLQTPEGEIISPHAFMPAAERYGLCSAIDGEVVKCCLDWLEENAKELEDLALCSVNLTGPSLRDKRLLDQLVHRIKHSRVPGEKLCFEISETTTIANLSSARRFIAALADLGCQFSLDDFGSGMSSFQFLRDLPIDYLKIDGLFVREMLEDPVSLAMVRSINEICHVLGRKTVAESVETREVYDHLVEMGVDFVQGYYIARPVMIDPD